MADELWAEPVGFTNSRGMHLSGLLCSPRGREPHALVVLPPAFEKRIHHYGVLSRYLVREGFATLRFDLTNHVGLSDGEILDYTVTSTMDDVQSVLSRIPDRVRELERHVVAPSLTARAVVRALSSATPDVRSLFLILPVVDCQHTFRAVAEEGRDVVAEWRAGGLTDARARHRFLGHTITLGCARDAVESGYDDVARARDEIAAIECPVTAVVAEKDDWVLAEDASAAMSGPSRWPRHVLMLEATSHEVGHNTPMMRTVVEAMLAALAETGGRPVAEVRHLEFDDVVETITTEKGWARARYQIAVGEEART